MSTSSQPFDWLPSRELVDGSNLSRFIRKTGLDSLQALQQRADDDPAWLTQQVFEFCDFRFYKPYERMLDTSAGIEWARWCVGGTTNIVLNCIDRHRETPVWDQVFLVWEGEQPTDQRQMRYRELSEAASRLAGALRDLGVQRGDRVALFMPNLPETVVAFFAILKIGAIAVPLFSGFGPQPLSARLNDAGAKLVLTVDVAWRRGKPESMKRVLDAALEDCPTVSSVLVLGRLLDSDVCAMKPGRDFDWATLTRDQSAEFQTMEMQAEDPAVLFYTSGTTGKPKGCVWTHVGFLASMVTRDIHICGDFRSTDRFFFMSDMGWMVGAMCACIPSYFGASVLVAEGTPDYPDAGRFWRLLQVHQVTYVGVAPTLIRGLMRDGVDEVRRHDLSALRITVSAGEPWTETPWRWFFDNVCQRKLPFLNVVGGTEVGGCNFIGTLHHPLRPGSFGLPGLGAGVEIVDSEGKPVAAGQIGELVLRNPNIGMTKGVWNDSARYIESYWSRFPGRWYHGDLALMDEDHLYYILGRSDDVIKIAGKRVGPSEVETLLLATRQVSEAAVVGIPDDLKGSVLVAVCVPMPGVNPSDQLGRALSDALVQGMGSSFRPKHVLFVRDLPKTRNMKIMRRVVRSAVCGQGLGDLSSLSNPESVKELQAVAESL